MKKPTVFIWAFGAALLLATALLLGVSEQQLADGVREGMPAEQVPAPLESLAHRRPASLPLVPAFQANPGDRFSFQVDWTSRFEFRSGADGAAPLNSDARGMLVVTICATTAQGYVAQLLASGFADAPPVTAHALLTHDGIVAGYAFPPTTLPRDRWLTKLLFARTHQFACRPAAEPWTLASLVDEQGRFAARFAWVPGGSPALSRTKLAQDSRSGERVPTEVRVAESFDEASFDAGWLSQCRVAEVTEIDVGGIQARASLQLRAVRTAFARGCAFSGPTPIEFLPYDRPEGSGVDEVLSPRPLPELVQLLAKLESERQIEAVPGHSAWMEIAAALRSRPADLEALLAGVHDGSLRPPRLSERVFGMLITALGVACQSGNAGCIAALASFVGAEGDASLQIFAIASSHQLRSLGAGAACIVGALRRACTGAGDPEVVAMAPLALGTLYGPGSDPGELESTRRLLQAKFGDETMLGFLGNTRNQQLIARHAIPLAADARDSVRAAAAETLRAVPANSEASQQLGRLAKNDPSTTVKRMALESLGDHPASFAVPVLAATATTELDTDLRQVALLALGKHCSHAMEARFALEWVAGHDTVLELRAFAGAILDRMAGSRAK